MSEVLTGSPAGTIYGTYADCVVYIDGKFGDAYRTWEELDAADRKRTLLTAAAYLNRLLWVDDYDTFSERDALQAFKDASYELGAMIAADPDIVALADQSSNLDSVGAGGAYVNFKNATSVAFGSATKLPPILQALLGDYLAGGGGATIIGGVGATGECRNPLSECSDFDREEPF